MTEAYLAGAINHAIERARALSTVIDQSYPRAYDSLRTICSERLRGVLEGLRDLQVETIVESAIQTPIRLRKYRRALSRLDEIETIGATALAAADKDASDLTGIVRDVCDELAYPLVPPTVANISSSYLGIYSGFNLMLAPLLEGRFLLHLPDLYHELAHPFLDRHYEDRANLDPYRQAFKTCLIAISHYFRQQHHTVLREREPIEVSNYLRLWEWSWANYWLEEFFCDAFATLTCGPAYGWAHHHLAAKTADDLFDTPFGRRRTHPSDDARLRLILVALRQRGFVDNADMINARWLELSETKAETAPPEYLRCYPDALLSLIVDEVCKSIQEMGVVVATPGAMTSWPARFGDAWSAFWDDPEGYPEWEKHALRVSKTDR